MSNPMPDYAPSVLSQNIAGTELQFTPWLSNDMIALGNQNRPLLLPNEHAYQAILIDEILDSGNKTSFTGTRTFDRLIERPLMAKSVKSKIIAKYISGAASAATVTASCRLQIQRITGQQVTDVMYDTTITLANYSQAINTTQFIQFNFDQVSLERLIQYYDLIRVIITITISVTIAQGAGSTLTAVAQQVNADRSTITFRTDPYAVGDRVR